MLSAVDKPIGSSTALCARPASIERGKGEASNYSVFRQQQEEQSRYRNHE